MPDGLEQAATVQDFGDVLAFQLSLKQRRLANKRTAKGKMRGASPQEPVHVALVATTARKLV